jgi:hypothetical protein
LFSRLGHTLSITWGAYAAFYGMSHLSVHDYRRMNTSADVSKIKTLPFNV